MVTQTAKLDERELATLSRELRARHVALKRRLEQREGGYGPGGEVHDMKDEASAEALDEVRAAHEQRDSVEMSDIEQALARMHAETYGLCVDCGQAIGLERLRVYPTAKRCRHCQESHEQRAGVRLTRH